MIASHSCCRFVGCTSMMWISRSSTSQRCSIGLRSGDCGGHLSKVNSLSCSRNQSEMIWALWHGALSCWKYIRRCVYCSHKGMDMVSNNTQVDWVLVLKWYQENIPHIITPPAAWTVETRQDDPCFHVLYTKYWPYIWMSQQKSRLIRPGNVFQSSIVQFWWVCVNCILRVLFLSDRSGTRCGLLLLEPICFRVRRVVCSEMVFCRSWL